MSRGIRDERVLAAMREVPREAFVPGHLAAYAYEDSPLPIGSGQTISQPYIVAEMIAALRLQGGEKVLEVGAGSGYAAAVLAQIAGEVFAIERIEDLAAGASHTLKSLGYSNVHLRHGDGTHGWQEHAPFDAILVSADAPKPPQPLLDQLAPGGRLVIPVGPLGGPQNLVRVTRLDDGTFQQEALAEVRFVPLIGEEGWGGGDRGGGAA